DEPVCPGAGRADRGIVELPDQSVCGKQHEAAAGELRKPVAGGGERCGAAAGRAGTAGRGRTRAGGGGVEPNGGGVSAGKRGRAVPGAGEKKAGGDGGGVWRGEAELRGVEPAGQPVGTLFKEDGSRAGGAGGDLRGAEPGDDRGAVGDREGGRGLCAAGSGI